MELLDSDLSQEGLAICRDLHASTGIPTYYYLYHAQAESREQDRERPCPSCQGEWLLPTPWHKFDFRCDRCRLVSHIAWDIQ